MKNWSKKLHIIINSILSYVWFRRRNGVALSLYRLVLHLRTWNLFVFLRRILLGLRIQGEPPIVSLRLKTILSKLVEEMQSSVLQCLEVEPTKCLCVRLILRAKNDATSSLLNALKLFRLVNSDIAMPDRSSVLAYWPNVAHVHRNKDVCWNSKKS